MNEQKPKKLAKSGILKTTIGEFVEAVYDSAMEEYMDEIIARRIAMQMLIRKMRLQYKSPTLTKINGRGSKTRP